MRLKRLLLPAVLALLFAAAGFFVAPPELFTEVMPQAANKHNAAITKAGKDWKVGKVTAKKDEEVTWSAADSDLYFQFMDSTLFGAYNYTLKKSHTLTLKVKGSSGVYPYAIFHLTDLAFIKGNSPPTIIIN